MIGVQGVDVGYTGLGVGVWGSGVHGLRVAGCRVQGAGFMVCCLGAVLPFETNQQ